MRGNVIKRLLLVVSVFQMFCRCCNAYACVLTGEMEQQVSELISGLSPSPVEESPYEALFEASSCVSLDSLASGKSSDRDSGRPDSEAGKVCVCVCVCVCVREREIFQS